MTTATEIWRALLRDVLARGEPVEQTSAGAAFRGRTSYELIANQTVWPLDRAVILCPARRLGHKFLAAESAWILSGSNRLEEIAPHAPQLAKLSDDGLFLSGAYGPPWVEQLPYLVAALTDDPASRQAVSIPWRPRPGRWKDVPCTTSLQFLIRSATIHCVATMRSNDVWFGTVYDVHTFAMLTAYLALLLRSKLGPLRLGSLYLTAGSQHLYLMDRESAVACAARDDELVDLAPLDLADFRQPGELITHLWAFARRSGVSYGGWLEGLRT